MQDWSEDGKCSVDFVYDVGDMLDVSEVWCKNHTEVFQSTLWHQDCILDSDCHMFVHYVC